MSVARAKAHVAVESKKFKRAGGESPPQSLQDAKRVLAAENLAQYIEQTVAAAPSLTAEQRDRLAVLLHGAGVSK